MIRKKLYTALDKASDCPTLTDLLITGLKSWHAQTQIPHHQYPPSIQHVIMSQEAIHWNQLYLGQFTNNWMTYYVHHKSYLPQSTSRTPGKQWTTIMTTVIWNHLFLAWELRNITLHGHDNKTRELAAYHCAQIETEALYRQHNLVLPRDQQLFYQSVNDHYAHKPTSTGLIQWINTWKPAILASIQEARCMRASCMRNIQSYFSTNR